MLVEATRFDSVLYPLSPIRRDGLQVFDGTPEIEDVVPFPPRRSYYQFFESGDTSEVRLDNTLMFIGRVLVAGEVPHLSLEHDELVDMDSKSEYLSSPEVKEALFDQLGDVG